MYFGEENQNFQSGHSSKKSKRNRKNDSSDHELSPSSFEESDENEKNNLKKKNNFKRDVKPDRKRHLQILFKRRLNSFFKKAHDLNSKFGAKTTIIVKSPLFPEYFTFSDQTIEENIQDFENYQGNFHHFRSKDKELLNLQRAFSENAGLICYKMKGQLSEKQSSSNKEKRISMIGEIKQPVEIFQVRNSKNYFEKFYGEDYSRKDSRFLSFKKEYSFKDSRSSSSIFNRYNVFNKEHVNYIFNDFDDFH